MINPKKLKEKIMERGYWEISILPSEYSEDRLSFDKICELIEKHQVRHRGWFYPHIPRGSGYDEWYNKESFVESLVHWGAYLEIFRFYRSGQFVHYVGMFEDRIDDEHPMYVPWTPSMEKGPPKRLSLNPSLTVYKLTEILLFASRLGSEGVFGRDVEISVKLHNLDGRILKSFEDEAFRHYKSHTDVIDLGTRCSIEDLQRNHDQWAIDWALRVLEAFQVKPTCARKSLEDDQMKFYSWSHPRVRIA